MPQPYIIYVSIVQFKKLISTDTGFYNSTVIITFFIKHIKCLMACGKRFHTFYAVGSDNNRISFLFKLFGKIYTFIISFRSMSHVIGRLRIFSFEQLCKLRILFRLTDCISRLCKNNNKLITAIVQSFLNRNGIAKSTVIICSSVYIKRFTNNRY